MRIKWVLPPIIGVALLSAAVFFIPRPSSEIPFEDAATEPVGAAAGAGALLDIVRGKADTSPSGRSSDYNAALQQNAITYNEGRLSLSVDKSRLDRVLEAIQNKTMVMITADGLQDSTVSMHFENLPLDDGLRALLSDFDTFFFYNSAPGTPSLKAVWVYPEGQGNAIMPVPPEKWASTGELEASLTDPDAETRARAIEDIIGRRRSKSMDAVLNALADKEDMVRNRALYKSIDTGLQLPSDVLGSLALGDTDETVRLMALQALAEKEAERRAEDPKHEPDSDTYGAAAVAERMMANDPNPALREEAKAVLARFKDASSPAEPGETNNSGQNEILEK